MTLVSKDPCVPPVFIPFAIQQSNCTGYIDEIWYSTFTKIELILLHVEEQYFEQQQKLTFFWGTVIAPLICKHVK